MDRVGRRMGRRSLTYFLNNASIPPPSNCALRSRTRPADVDGIVIVAASEKIFWRVEPRCHYAVRDSEHPDELDEA